MKILVVDDHALFRESLQNLLSLHGYQLVGSVGNGLEALEKARSLHPDLILMDIEMPVCDGLAATRLIKAEMPEIKIVMLTVNDQDEKLFEAIKSGAMGYLLKSVRANQLLWHLGQLNEGQLPLSPGLAEKILEEFGHMRQQLETNTEPAHPESGELTGRQIEILTLVGQGLTYQQIAETLYLSERTIRYHMGEIMERLHLENRAQVIAYASRRGLIGDRNQDTT